MRIGVHPSNLHLRIAALLPGAFAHLGGRFVFHEDGRQTADLIAKGGIQFGGTGSTPPIAAEAAGHEVIYVAASAPRPANGALIVRADGTVARIGDLAGRRVALLDGSFHNFLLARALEETGLTLRDVALREVPAADALDALLAGRVDAWVAMSPRLEAVEDHAGLRVLARCGASIPNRSHFWTLGSSALSPIDRAAIAAELARIGALIEADKPEIAERLARAAGSEGSEGSAATWRRVLAARDFTVRPADAAILAEQSEEADVLRRHGYVCPAAHGPRPARPIGSQP